MTSTATTTPISRPPRLFRSSIARGLKAGSGTGAIDPAGGDEKAGIIRGISVITRGEAIGHDIWIDRQMLLATGTAINSKPDGAKSRFTHPSLSGDGLGKYTGRVKNASLDGDVLRADLHFSKTAHETPEGDLAGYLLRLAATDPSAFGNSIAFQEDFAAEEAFMLANGARWVTDAYGNQVLKGFRSPDPQNVDNLPHARLKELRAVDAVDDPAANPGGLFHRGQEWAEEGEALLAWTLGLTAKKPSTTLFGVDPDRAKAFVSRLFARHGLSLSKRPASAPAPAPATRQMNESERVRAGLSKGLAKLAEWNKQFVTK